MSETSYTDFTLYRRLLRQAGLIGRTSGAYS